MTDALDKVQGIQHLPLFPLPLVMLPGELLPLHVFEDRYRQLLTDIKQDRDLFGVSYFDPKDAYIEKPTIGSIGCVAEVRDTETLPDGRSNIMTFGIVRYRILDYVEAGEPYLVGDLAFLEDEPEDETVLIPLAEVVFELFERIAKAAFKLSGNRGRFPAIERTEPERMSFLITAAFNFENELKYSLLEMTSTLERLSKLREILSQLVSQMEENADTRQASQTNGHSKKKIEF